MTRECACGADLSRRYIKTIRCSACSEEINAQLSLNRYHELKALGKLKKYQRKREDDSLPVQSPNRQELQSNRPIHQ